MDEIEKRLRALFDQIAAPTDVERLIQSAPTHAPLSRLRWAAMVAAPTLAVAALAAAAVALRNDAAPLQSPPTTPSHASTTTTTGPASTGASTTTTAAAPGPGLVWARVPHDEGVFGGPDYQEANAVVAGGPGLVAVGYDTDTSGGEWDLRAAVWTSPDGLVWSRVPHDEAVFGGYGGREMRAVVAGGPGLVAVGWAVSEDGNLVAAVWTSPDGLVWSRVPHDEAVFGGPGGLSAVVAGGPGLVAVGYEEDTSGEEWDDDAAVWTSPDGLVWSRVPPDESVFGGPGNQEMTAVTAGGPGLVAVGYEEDTSTVEGDRVAAVWTSPDGLVWSRVPHDEAVFGGPDLRYQSMWGVTAGGPGLVAVGLDSSGEDLDAAVWTSPDGLVWSRVPEDEAVFGGPGDQGMGEVTAAGPDLVAVGYEENTSTTEENRAAAAWTSPDGLVWSRVPHDEAVFGGPGNQEMKAVVAGGPGLVAVGLDHSDGDDDAAVWVGLRPG